MRENNLDKEPRYTSFEEMLRHSKEEYYKEKYDAESVEKSIIDNIILKKRKSGLKRAVSIVATIALILSSSVVISKTFLSDTGYANYLIKKCIYFISPDDRTIERFPDGSTITEIHIDKEHDLRKLNKIADINYEFGYIPKEYIFKYCDAYISSGDQMIVYFYEYGNLNLCISTHKFDKKSSISLKGSHIKTLDNGAELICTELDNERYSDSLVDVEGNVYNITGNGERDEIIAVAENIIIRQ